MHPAFSVIVFTTLSGAGYGLLIAVALAVLLEGSPANALLALVGLALALVTIGLLSSLAHLGKPLRAWRSFSQWRTSWLSREGVMAVLTYVPALAMAALLLPNLPSNDASALVPRGNVAGIAVSIAVIALSLATIVCTAMIYASLKPIPAWRQRWVVPGYLAFALLSGTALLGAGLAVSGNGAAATTSALAAIIAALALLTAAIKHAYWREIDATALPATRGDAVGLPGRDVSVFERPHTDDNYLTREMGFVVARKHAPRLRVIALALFTALPLLATLGAWLMPASAPVMLPLAALGVMTGALIERWLFFAQARHLVTLYY